MTTTYPILRVGGTATDVSILKLSEALFTLVKEEVISPLITKSTYTIASGDQSTPTTVVVQCKKDPKGNGGRGVISTTFAFNTFVQRFDDSVLVYSEPVSAVLAVNLPANVPMVASTIVDMLENLYSLWYTTITTKEPDTDRISKTMLFGVSRAF